ncbi:MAG: FixH family protein [Bacteroidia bacterium]
MSWGIRITIVYSSFVLMIITLGILSSRQKADLVSADYYEKEVKYQEKINGIKNTAGLSGCFTSETKAGSVVLYYPSALAGKKIKGEILFYRPSDSERDEHFTADPDQRGSQQFILKHPLRGLYKLQCDIEVEGSKYYFEEPVQIN